MLLRICVILVAVLVRLGPSRAHAEGPPARELLLFDEPQVTAAAKRPQAARFLPTPIPKLVSTAGLYNFLNSGYADSAGSEHRQDSIPQDRFTFRVQVHYAL